MVSYHSSASNNADAIIIGGGIHGCSAALHLALAGVSVIVLEKDYVGRHASGVNAGGVRRLGRALPEIPLAMASAKMWESIEDLVDDDCGFESSFQIKVAEDEKGLEHLKDRSKEVRAIGFSHEKIIDRKALQELMPAVADHCVGAMMVEGDGFANPFRTVQAFRRKCEKLGVVFRQGVKVNNINKTGNSWSIQTSVEMFETANLVNCAGAWAGDIATTLGEGVPIEGRAPMLMITARMPAFVTPVVGVQGCPLSFKQFANGTVLIGGGHEGQANLETNETILDFAKLSISAETASRLFPVMRDARIVRCWAGIEGVMPDHIPVIGPSQVEGAFHAFGFSAHGFQLGPVGGKIMRDLIIDGKTDLPIAPFRITRFADA